MLNEIYLPFYIICVCFFSGRHDIKIKIHALHWMRAKKHMILVTMILSDIDVNYLLSNEKKIVERERQLKSIHSVAHVIQSCAQSSLEIKQ